MKVFLSHSTKDADFVKQLAAAIIGARSEAWLCEVDVGKYENFVSKIEEGLKWCEVALLIWSPDAAASTWTEEEWTSVLARQVAEQKTRLGIVMLRDYPLPELLRTKNYIDARRDQQEALRQTVAWIEQRESVKRFLGLPEYRPQDFVGRGPHLQQLRGTFSGEPMVFLLHGEPGTGKSTLALQFAWEAQKDFDAVIFQTCGQRPLDAITAELVERLPIEVKTLAPDQQRAAAKAWLRQRQSLLVLDDVWRDGDGKTEVTQLEPGPACSVLYTSRQRTLPGIGAQQAAQVEKFTEPETEELFRAVLIPTFKPDEIERNRDVLLGFARSVDMLPIAVAVGASLLRGMEAVPLEEGVLELRLQDLVTDAKHDVPALFRMAIESQPEREQRLLAACAVCVQEGFWLPLGATIAGIDLAEVKKAAVNLVRASLLRVLDRDRQRFQLHALLREQLRARSGTEGLAALQGRHAAALEQLFKDWERRWRDCRECLEEIIPAAVYLRQAGERTREKKASILGFNLAWRTGELDAAFRIAKGMGPAGPGHDDSEARDGLMRSFVGQALILQDWGRLQEALAFHERAEEIALQLGRKGQLERTYTDHVRILYSWGQLEEAMALLKKQEAICLELDNKDGLSRSYGNQGVILRDWGRLEEALELHKKQEAISLELGNKDGLHESYGNQAQILQDWGRLEEALELLEKMEEISLELGNKDSLQRGYGNQANILYALGRLEAAMELHKKEEAICLELGNKEGLQASYRNQALILIKQSCLHEAIILLERSEAICTKLGLKKDLGHCYSHWGLLARAQHDHASEKQKLQQALALFIELNMPIERDAVQSELDKAKSGD